MKKISLVAAMTNDRVIGKDNQMPWHLPADLKHFKALTVGKPVIMGRKTFDSLGKPLPDRTNIVISANPDFQPPGCTRALSLEHALGLVSDKDEVMIIGGAQIYELAMPLASHLYLTLIDVKLEGDTYFPAWDESTWTETARESHIKDGKNPYNYTFITLVRT